MHIGPLATEGVAVPARLTCVDEFEFVSRPDELRTARQRLATLARKQGLAGAGLFEFSVAAGEALANAVRHGSPHGAKDHVSVRFSRGRGVVAVEIHDHGMGFSSSPLCVPDALESGGRGIHFMRSLSDEVSFECAATGTTVRILKRMR
jgi:anti-sigma regulatory factor (Ser/Thr protein kinase)